MAASAEIPVIDIADADQTKVARELVDAAVKCGFVYIKNRGEDIPADVIESTFNLSRKLFDSPTAEKQECSIQTNNRGWSGMHVETLDPGNQRVGDFKEAFNFGEFLSAKPQQPLPSSMTGHEGEIASFFDYCYHLSLKLNSLLGLGLEVTPPDFFRSAHLREKGRSGNTLRWLRYPPLSQTADASVEDVRAGAHSDYGSLTLLFRLKGQAGLEVHLPDAGGWQPVPVCPPGTEDDPSPPILVNIGDLLSYWTGGLLRSTVHRVVFPGGAEREAARQRGEDDKEPRYSIAFFCHPVGTAALEPVPSERVRAFARSDAAAAKTAASREGNPYADRRDKVLTADEHLQMRLRASYGGLYEDDGDKKAE